MARIERGEIEFAFLLLYSLIFTARKRSVGWKLERALQISHTVWVSALCKESSNSKALQENSQSTFTRELVIRI